MLKRLDTLLDPDPGGPVLHLPHGPRRTPGAATLVDLHARVDEIVVHEGVPGTVREAFDLARNALVYAWYVRGFAALAERQARLALSLGLAERARREVTEAMPDNLPGALCLALRQGWLDHAALAPAVAGEDRDNVEAGALAPLLQPVAGARGGGSRLALLTALQTLELCGGVLDLLFHGEGAGAPSLARDAPRLAH